MKILAIVATFICLIGTASAHPGGLNSSRCHNDYIHGGYHCH